MEVPFMEVSRCIYLTKEEEISDFYERTFNTEGHTQLELHPNEYIFVGNEVYCYQDDFIRRVNYNTIDSEYSGTIKPRNIEQIAAIDMLQDRTSKVKILRGVYGSGKDYLMINAALSLVGDGTYDKIVFVRPNLTLKNMPSIGALPGDENDKLSWTLAPLYDKVGGKEGLDYLVANNKIEMVPLLFIRGRSFENSIIYVTEAQNIDVEIAKLLLGRVGENSELWLNGDNHQTDSRIFDKNNGLSAMVNRLIDEELFAYVYLPKTERSNVANLANLLD